MRLEVAGERHVLARQADLFFGLAQRRRQRTFVGAFDASARKADLSGVILQVRGALREQHRQPFFAIDQRHEHCRRNRATPENTGARPRRLPPRTPRAPPSPDRSADASP